ncbi:unnamed protein product [Calypogeia fissa]
METLQVGEREEGSSPDLRRLDGSSDHGHDSLTANFLSSEDKRFDASQYAFFGGDVAHEVEIGGLDEEEEFPPQEEDEEDDVEEALEVDVEEISLGDGDGQGSSTNYGRESDLQDVVSDLGFLNIQSKISSSEGDSAALLGNLETARKLDVGGGKGVAADFSKAFDPIPGNWLDHHRKQEAPVEQVGGRRWWPNSQQQSNSAAELVGSSLGPSSLQALQQKQWPSPGPSIPPPAAALYPPTQYAPQSLPFSGVTFPSQYGTSGSIISPLAPPPAQWVAAQSNMQLGSVSGSFPQQLPPLHSSLLPPQVVLQYQLPHVAGQLHGVVPPPYPPHPKPQHKYHGTPLPPQMLPRMGMGDSVGSGGEFRDSFPPRGGRQTQRHHQHGLTDGQIPFRNTQQGSGWQPLRSKYMTVEEIENIVRIQWAATHSGDPYVDDYYHQAVQAKLSRGSPHGRRHFSPSHLRDLPSHTRATVEPHAYLQVDALGRVPFSSIRRPRPLLDVDSGQVSGGLLNRLQGDGSVDAVSQYRPLEQEPMLAARIAIEEGLCLLLDVDDIDRLLTTSQPPDGGAQLRRRRQLLVEGVAASLQLVGTSGDDGVSGGFTGITTKDDLLFLRLVSLPKGRKLLTRYLQLLIPGSELTRIVVVAIFRHLRFLFGGVQSDPSFSAITAGLANAAAVSVMGLDLSGLSTCLAAVLLAPEQPPLRPMGSPAGDGATVVLRAVLERATGLLNDRNAAYPLQNRAVWQASFDAFFALLTKYCTNKYDSIFHSLMMASSSSPAAVNASAAAAMSKEMPVELLRASLPHTNDHQRNILLEFTQRSMSMGSSSPGTVTDGHASTASARG